MYIVCLNTNEYKTIYLVGNFAIHVLTTKREILQKKKNNNKFLTKVFHLLKRRMLFKLIQICCNKMNSSVNCFLNSETYDFQYVKINFILNLLNFLTCSNFVFVVPYALHTVATSPMLLDRLDDEPMVSMPWK